MKARPFKQTTASAFPAEQDTTSEVDEALAIHAARQPRKKPPNEMPITPTLPRVPKPRRRTFQKKRK